MEREAAQAISETELLTSEPTTVVLSRLGWVRAAKGHDIDVRALSYKSGDEYQAAAKGRNLQQAVFIDSPAAPTAWMRTSCRPRAVTASRCPARWIRPTAPLSRRS